MSSSDPSHEERVARLERAIASLPRREAQGGAAARAALIRAQTLAGMLREESVDTIGPYLDQLDRDQLYALACAGAAMVPLDVPVEDLLGWLEPLGRQLERESQRAAA